MNFNIKKKTQTMNIRKWSACHQVKIMLLNETLKCFLNFVKAKLIWQVVVAFKRLCSNESLK